MKERKQQTLKTEVIFDNYFMFLSAFERENLFFLRI